MLKFSILFATSRKAVIEVEDFGVWETTKPYEIWLDGEKVLESQKAVETVTGLKPDTVYRAQIRTADDQSEEVELKTRYESVTLNVKRSTPWATASTTIPRPSRRQSWPAPKTDGCTCPKACTG